MHCHTKMSDGSASIDEVVLMAKKLGLKTIAVTDHDTFAGATRACVYGRRQGIEVIHGAEISCIDSARGRKVHILCYLCQNPDRLEGVFKRTKERRQRAAALMLQKVMRQYPITPDMVSRRAQGSTNIYKQHIMHALLDAGYTNEIFGDLFRSLFHPKEGSAYAPVEYPEVTEIVPKIHEAGGLAAVRMREKEEAVLIQRFMTATTSWRSCCLWAWMAWRCGIQETIQTTRSACPDSAGNMA